MKPELLKLAREAGLPVPTILPPRQKQRRVTLDADDIHRLGPAAKALRNQGFSIDRIPQKLDVSIANTRKLINTAHIVAFGAVRKDGKRFVGYVKQGDGFAEKWVTNQSYLRTALGIFRRGAMPTGHKAEQITKET